MKKTITTVAASTLAVGIVVYGAIQWQNYLIDLQNRFPDLDPKVVRKAYSNMLRKSFTGQYTQDLSDLTDEQMDELFLEEVRLLSTHH